MKYQSEIELQNNGISEKNRMNQQLAIAIKAFHVIAMLRNGNPAFMAEYAMEALREIETLDFIYDQYSSEYN
jgi:hypothetical protein|tara:strand:+ start:1674 stop:1889 length:216 start_codon:yes stop_codon:yes gene_type:complete